MYWIDWIRGWLAPALDWFEAHPGTASWPEAVIPRGRATRPALLEATSVPRLPFEDAKALLQARRAR